MALYGCVHEYCLNNICTVDRNGEQIAIKPLHTFTRTHAETT